MLIKSMYSWRGYPADDIELSIFDPNRVTLEASTEQLLFGTLTVGLDSENGLLADELYQDEIDALRERGGVVCEITKFAMDPRYSSIETMAALMHLAHIYAHNLHHSTDLLIEVNPRHLSFYQRRLSFRQIGEERVCPRVDAPAVLLHISLEYAAKQIEKNAGNRDSSDRSLYRYFFSVPEIQGLSQRVRAQLRE